MSIDRRFKVRTEYGAFSGDYADMIPRYVYFFGQWEPNISRLISQRLRPGHIFVDVGANTGWYSLLAAEKVGPTGRVVAIEASPTNFSWLEDNVNKSRLRNVRLINEAVWSSRSLLSLFQGPPSNSGLSTVVPSFAEPLGCELAGQVHARPLPEILSPDELSMMRILKIDVEGAERAVLKGLEPALDSVSADLEIFLELTPTAYDVDEVLEPFRNRGFRAWIVPNSYDPEHYLTFTDGAETRKLEELCAAPDQQVDVILSRNRPE